MTTNSLPALVRELNELRQDFPPTRLFEDWPPAGGEQERKSAVRLGWFLWPMRGPAPAPDAAAALLAATARVLERHLPERTADLTRMREAIGERPGGPRSLVVRSLANDTRHLLDLTRAAQLPADLLLFLALFLARPYRRSVAEHLLRGVDLEAWWRGYCPACGHWPGLALLGLESARRDLWCAACDTQWPFTRIQCPFCLAEDPERIRYLELEKPGLARYRLYLCDGCRRYLKCVTIPAGEPLLGPDRDLAFLQSAALDCLASQRGYIQEPVTSVRYDPEAVGRAAG
jgi:FdhE protein